MNMPLISVLIPTFNYARYLPEAIESVLAQDFDDYELLIVDDNSSDNTAEVAGRYCGRNPRVQFAAHSKNVGMVNNWNYCLQKARGEYIKYVFGDDKLCHPQALGKMSALLERHPAATLAASARVILDEQSEAVDIWRPLAEGCHDGRKIITAYLMENGQNLVGEPSAVMFRKKDARRGFDPKYRQIVDVEMWIHLLEKGDLAYTRQPLCAFRCHPSQQTERHAASGLGRREHAVFFSNYATQMWVPRKAVVPLLFHLRRNGLAASAPEFLESERRLIGRLGKGWRWFYWLYCLRYRAGKPFRNLNHSLQKRWFRRRFRAGQRRQGRPAGIPSSSQT